MFAFESVVAVIVMSVVDRPWITKLTGFIFGSEAGTYGSLTR